MNIIKPKKIKKGDTIAIIAPAGNLDKIYIDNAIKYFEQKDFRVKTGKHILSSHNYLAGKDDKRLSDLHEAFEDKEVKAIICARGGYGSLRLINKIDYDIIKNNPKIFCGYSDITVLSLMFLKHANLMTYSSPMAKGDFQIDNIDSFTEEHFWQTIENDNIKIEPQNIKIYNNGDANGILWGGNLASVVSLCGQDFIPDEEFIFFCEDLNEPVYKLDKYFRQLLNIEKFRKNVSAFIFGDFLDVEYPNQLEELLSEISLELNIPSYGGFNITHNKSKLTIPIGAKASVKSGSITLSQ